jgi:hypothetical protein
VARERLSPIKMFCDMQVFAKSHDGSKVTVDASKGVWWLREDLGDDAQLSGSNLVQSRESSYR